MMYAEQQIRLPPHPTFLAELRFDRSEIASIVPSSIKSESSGSFLNFDRVCTAKRGVWCPAPVLVVTVALALLSFIISNASVYYLSVSSCAYLMNNHPNRRTNSAAQILSADFDKLHTTLPARIQQSTDALNSADEKQQSKAEYESKHGKKLIDLGSPNETNVFQLPSKSRSAAANYPGIIVADADNPARVRLKVLDPTTTIGAPTSPGSATTSQHHSQIVNRIFDLPELHSSTRRERPPGVFTISADIEPIASGDKSADTKYDLVNFVFYKRTESPSSSIETTTTTTTTLAPITFRKSHQALPQQQPPVIVVSNDLAWKN